MKHVAAVLVVLALAGCQGWKAQPAARAAPAARPAAYSPEARALYDAMVSAFRDAESLSFQSDYSWESQGMNLARVTYKAWVSKPNYARIEATNAASGTQGVIVIDGATLWTWWPTGKPRFTLKDQESMTMYMRESAPAGAHSLGHAVGNLGTGIAMTILDLSTFHGYTDSLQPYVDGVIGMGTEKLGDETFDVIEVSIMDHQRSRYLWLSRVDHLPRKLHEVVRVEHEITTDELWSDVEVNAPISAEKYQWSPPQDWTEYRLPSIEEGLLSQGTPAPDFELASIDGRKIRLSSLTGKIVWIAFWRVGCPPCREEFPHLEKVHDAYRKQGVEVIGYNCSDDREIALTFIKETGATFPSILDTSQEALNVCFSRYQTMGWSAVPLNYVIGRDGTVAAAWYGYNGEGDTTGERILDELIASSR
jgi:peroxiredoxin